jgi:hypothetical protein
MKWLKNWLLSSVKALLLKEIDALDQYKPVIADIIKKNVDPDKTAQMVVDYVKELALKLVDKVF